MATFEATTLSEADVAFPRERIWSLLTDPGALARLTPLLERIDADGSTWVWRMRRVSALGVGITPVFTEAMTFDEGTRIEFDHRPPAGGDRERVGAKGLYQLSDTAGGGAHLKISLTVQADLPLPKASASAVKRVMRQTMAMMGDRFAKNLLAELERGDPSKS